MLFSELPADIIQTLFDKALFEWGLWHAVRYRLVSSKLSRQSTDAFHFDEIELFDEQIRSTVCRTRYLELYPFPEKHYGPNAEFRQQYLEHVIRIGNPGGLKLAQAIMDILEAMEQWNENCHAKNRSERIRLLAAAGLGPCSSTKEIWLSVDPERDDRSVRWRRGLTVENNLLMGAIICEELTFQPALLNKREDLSLCNYFFGTPLACAANVGSQEMVKLLLDHGARDIRSDGPLAISVAASHGHDQIIRLLLDSHDRSCGNNTEQIVYSKHPYYGDAFGSMLLAAIEGGYLSSIEILLASKVAEEDPWTHCLVMYKAIMSGHKDLWRLIEANPAHYRHEPGKSPWFYYEPFSAKGRDLEIVQRFLDKGRDAHGEVEKCVYLASQMGRLEIVRYAAEQPGDLWFSPRKALERATENGHIEVVRFLVTRYDGEEYLRVYESLKAAIERGFDNILRVIWPQIPKWFWEEPDEKITSMFQDFYAHAAVFQNSTIMRTLSELSAPYAERMCGELAAKVQDRIAEERESESPKFMYNDFCSPFCPKGRFRPATRPIVSWGHPST